MRNGCSGWLVWVVALMILAGSWANALAVQVTLAWDPPLMNDDGSTPPDVAGYRVYCGTSSRVYSITNNVGLTNSVTLTDLNPGITYFFAVTAYSRAGLDSGFSSELQWTYDAGTNGLPDLGSGTPGDFDGDGRSDIGCYYAPGGNWYVLNSKEGFWETMFGYSGTVPVTGDFDGDGRTDIGCYYAPGGNWYIFKSTEGFWETQFGYAGTVPVTGDFDGDGRTDLGCYYAPGGNWYISMSTEGFWQTAFGYAGTVPVTGDFDGDGLSDIGCYYEPGGNWYILMSTEGFWQTTFGYGGTVPLQ